MNHDDRPGVVLADDHRAMLSEVRNLLGSRFEVLEAVENGALAVEAVARHRPEIAVLDIAMPCMSGIEAAHQIQKLGFPTRIVFLTIQMDPEYIQVAQAMGAGFVLKSRMHSDLLLALDEALAGRAFVSPLLAQPLH